MNDTIIFLILAGIALIFKVLSKARSTHDAKPEPPAPNEPKARPSAESEQERVRRFLEALGVPPGTEPPPPVRTRQAIPRRVVTPTTPRSASEPATPLKWEQPLPPLTSAPPIEPVVAVEAPPVPAAPHPLARPLARAVAEQLPRPVARSLGEMLRARGSVRQAIILREVLGPPRGLQPLEVRESY